MRIQCPRCQALAEVTRFTAVTDPPRIEFRCTVCGEQITEAALEGPAPEVRPAAGEGPSLAEVAEVAEDGGDPGAAPARVAHAGGSDSLWNGWDRVAQRFEDPSRHDAFLAACEAADALPFAAARYRAWADSHPEDILAPALLKRIAALAQVRVLLSASRPSREKDPVRQAVVLGLLLLLVLAVVVLSAPLVFRGFASSDAEDRGSDRRGSDAERRRPSTREPPLQNLKRPPPPRAPALPPASRGSSGSPVPSGSPGHPGPAAPSGSVARPARS